MTIRLRLPAVAPFLAAAMMLPALTACASPPPPPPPGLGDARVASVVHASHAGEIAVGQMAADRASDARVRDFAQRMADEHTVADQVLTAVQNPMTTTDSMATELQRQTQRVLTSLDTYEGAAFDRAYMDTQVAQHEWLVTNLEGTLIPSAWTPQMRATLEGLRLTVLEHLRVARELRAALPPAAPATGRPGR
jgi:putative membrane protein